MHDKYRERHRLRIRTFQNGSNHHQHIPIPVFYMIPPLCNNCKPESAESEQIVTRFSEKS